MNERVNGQLEEIPPRSGLERVERNPGREVETTVIMWFAETADREEAWSFTGSHSATTEQI